MMRFQHHTIQELALAVRDSKANPNGYDKDSRDLLRRACRARLGVEIMDEYLKRYEHPTDLNLARQAWAEVQTFVKAQNYTSGVWTA